jgi:FkbM family methyltransferase
MVDVGAAYGSVAALFLEDGWTADLFEPDPACQRFLEPLLASYGPRIRLFPFAVAGETRDGVQFLQNATPGLSGLSESPFGTTLGAIEVRSVRLDGILATAGVARIDLLKIDTEGNDFAVLETCDFMRLPPTLAFVEYGYYFADQDEAQLRRALAAMRQRGYLAVIFEYDDDGNFKRGSWSHRLTAIHTDGVQVPTRPQAFGNVLFYRQDDAHLPKTLASAIRALT